MKLRNTFIAFAVLCTLVAALYFVKRGQDKKSKKELRSAKIISTPFDKLVSVRMTNGKGEILLERKSLKDKEGKEKFWFIVKPVNSEADQDLVKRMLDSLQDLSSTRSFTIEEKELGDYGLSKPFLSFDLKFQGENKTHQISFGSKNPNKTHQYIRQGSSLDLKLVDATLYQYGEKALKDLRNKKIFDFNKDDIVKVVASYPESKETFIIEKQDSSYSIIKPLKTKGDTSTLSSFLNNIANAKADDFPSEDYEVNPSRWGFDKPAGEIKVTLKKKLLETLLLGKETPDGKGLYVRKASAKNVYQAKISLKRNLSLKLSNIVNKKLAEWAKDDVQKLILTVGKASAEVEKSDGKWILAKYQDLADQNIVGGLLSKLANFRADEFVSTKTDERHGFDTMRAVHVNVFGKEGKELSSFDFGNLLPANKLFVRGGPENFVYKANANVSEKLRKDFPNLRNKRLSLLKRWDIKKIDYVTAEGSAIIEKKEGNWTINASGNLSYEKESDFIEDDVDTILDFLFDKKIFGFVDADNSKSSESDFGFDKPTVKFTFSEDGGKEESVVLGKKNPVGGTYYAKNTGRSAIYEMQASDVDALDKIFTKKGSKK